MAHQRRFPPPWSVEEQDACKCAAIGVYVKSVTAKRILRGESATSLPDITGIPFAVVYAVVV